MVLSIACTPTDDAIVPNNNSEGSLSREKNEINELIPENNDQQQLESEKNTVVMLEMNGKEMRASLNDTHTANVFLELLPVSFTVTKSDQELRGTLDEQLPVIASQGHNSWKTGEIAWIDGWFSILTGKEKDFSEASSVIVIGEIEKEYIKLLSSFDETVNVSIRLEEKTSKIKENEENNMMNVQVRDKTLKATLVNNSTTEALKKILEKGPITIEMTDYGSMEKVGPLEGNLPRNDQHITTEPGDLILYNGNAFVIYYDSNTWNFTRIGKIINIKEDELKAVLGNGDVSVTLSLSND